MTKVKALRNFFDKFFDYQSNGMTISEILNDVSENGTAPSGSGGGVPIIYTTTEDKLHFTFDKTFAEVKQMIDDGIFPVVCISTQGEVVTRKSMYPVLGYTMEGDSYMAIAMLGIDQGYFGEQVAEATSADAYPVYYESPVT